MTCESYNGDFDYLNVKLRVKLPSSEFNISLSFLVFTNPSRMIWNLFIWFLPIWIEHFFWLRLCYSKFRENNRNNIFQVLCQGINRMQGLYALGDVFRQLVTWSSCLQMAMRCTLCSSELPINVTISPGQVSEFDCTLYKFPGASSSAQLKYVKRVQFYINNIDWTTNWTTFL